MDLAPGAFLLVQVLGPMAVIALPSTPIFGGVKHFMPAMPFLAIAAAVGLRWLQALAAELVAERAGRAVAAAGGARGAGGRWSACRRWSRPGGPTPTGCRTTTCWRAASPAAPRWG